MARNKNTVRIRVDRDIIDRLRTKYPDTDDRTLHRLTYQTSLMRLEVGVDNFDKKLSEMLNVKKKTQKR